MDAVSSLFRVNMVTICSDSVNEACNLNSILDNYDLIDNLSRTTIRDVTSNTAHSITQLRLRTNCIKDSNCRISNEEIQRQLQEIVFEESNKFKPADLIDLQETPWFERWKDKFISHHINYDHDFIGANFGVFIILATKDLQYFDSVSAKLLSQVRENTFLRFLSPSFIEHYVVINTENDSNNVSESTIIPPQFEQSYNKFTNCFGSDNCSWINVPSSQPDLNFEAFFKNFINQSLIPWCERQIRILNNAISTRKGIKRNLFLVTRQLLNMSQTSYSNQSVVYTPDSGEMQCRKLGDIAMSLGLYSLASSSYDQAKREFLNDGAWLHYAGACEAYAASMYMQRKFQRNYIEKAVSTYIDPCKNIVLATRSTILAIDLLRSHSPRDAAQFFLTLTVNESDLLCGLFLEQASKCFALCGSMRKSAFHHVLAAYRYGKCGLKNLSLRCYAQFNASEWLAASEYVKLSTEHIAGQLNSPDQKVM